MAGKRLPYSLRMTDEEQPGTSVDRTPGQRALRVSHADRDQVAEALRIAAGDGRLTADELDERLERALTARTYADLTVLVADLPGAPGSGASPVAPAKEQVTIECRSSSTERVGRWSVPARIRLSAHSGGITLDFTEAAISYPELHIEADLHSSALTLVTRPGITVEAGEVALRSSTLKIPPPQGDGALPLLHVVVSGTCRSSVIRARPPQPPRPPRRTFWEWLRRAPRRQAISA